MMTDGEGTLLAIVHTGVNRSDHESAEPLLSQFKGIGQGEMSRSNLSQV